TALSAPSAVVVGQVPVVLRGPRVKANSPQVGRKIGAQNGTWSHQPTSFTFQWSHCDADGVSNCNAVTGLLSKGVYRPSGADLGHTLKVTVIAHNASGDSAPATSAATNVVS